MPQRIVEDDAGAGRAAHLGRAGEGVEAAERCRRGFEVGLVRAGHHHEIALVRLRHVGQEVADLQLQHRHPRPQVAEAVVGAVDVPAGAGGARSFLPERVGGMEVRLALVEQGANVGHHRRVVGQRQDQRVIRQQVEDPGTAWIFHTRSREVRRAAPLQLPAPRDRPLQRRAQVARPAARALLLILWALTKAQGQSQTDQRCKVRSVAAAVRTQSHLGSLNSPRETRTPDAIDRTGEPSCFASQASGPSVSILG